MNYETKEIFIKIILILGCVFGILAIFIPILAGLLCGKQMDRIDGQQYPLPDPFYTIWVIDIILAFGFGITFMILLPIFGGPKQKPVKAEKAPLAFSSYNEFLDFLQMRFLQKGYQMQKSIPVSPNGEVVVYLKPSKNWTLACFTIIRVPELLDELVDNANEGITRVLKEYYGCETITDTINMISVFCVDHITPAFQKLLNSNVQQGLKNGRFLVGVSFGGKNIYIARPKYGFAITKYKRLRKTFIDIMDLHSNNRNTGDGSVC